MSTGHIYDLYSHEERAIINGHECRREIYAAYNLLRAVPGAWVVHTVTAAASATAHPARTLSTLVASTRLPIERDCACSST